MAFPLVCFVLHNASRLIHLFTRSPQALIIDEIYVCHYFSNVQKYQSAVTRRSQSQRLALSPIQTAEGRAKKDRKLRMMVRS